MRLSASFVHAGAASKGVGLEINWVVNCSRVAVFGSIGRRDKETTDYERLVRLGDDFETSIIVKKRVIRCSDVWKTKARYVILQLAPVLARGHVKRYALEASMSIGL